MNKEELIKILKTMTDDCEGDHGKSDEALLKFINDEEITEAFNSVGKWYA